MQTLSGRFSTRGERGAGDPDRPRPCERFLLPEDSERSRLEERRPSRECDRDLSCQPFVCFVTFTLTFNFAVIIYFASSFASFA